jgi:hypothetical protein
MKLFIYYNNILNVFPPVRQKESTESVKRCGITHLFYYSPPWRCTVIVLCITWLTSNKT